MSKIRSYKLNQGWDMWLNNHVSKHSDISHMWQETFYTCKKKQKNKEKKASLAHFVAFILNLALYRHSRRQDFRKWHEITIITI